MLTLKELKKIVRQADIEKRIPCVSALKKSGEEIVVRERIGKDTVITVYANGYVLYQDNGRTTVFPLHMCRSYAYESSTGEMESIKEEFFDNQNWYIRLIIEASDLLERNQEKRISNHNVCSYSAYSEEWKVMKDSKDDVLNELIWRETFLEMLEILTEKQKMVVSLYYIDNLKQREIAQKMGISQQSVGQILKRALLEMRKFYKKI